MLSVWPEGKVQDRRIKPSHGYRAVHVILSIDDYPVELQVRTALQHLWAEVFEKAADEWGRQMVELEKKLRSVMPLLLPEIEKQ